MTQGLARIVVADSMKVKAIAWARIKSDKVDAFVLANLLRVDFIPEVKMPDQKHWELRQLISHREALSHRRSKIKGHIISLLHQNLLDSPHAEKFCKKGLVWLQNVELPTVDKFRMDQNISSLNFIENQIKELDDRLVANAKTDPRVSLLMTIPGFGLVVATGFLALIEDINRFENPKQLSAYFGLVPRLSQSGEKCLHGRITKAGSNYARWLAIEAAQAMVLSQSPLTATYWRIKKKKSPQTATVALARKITVLVWHMLRKNEPYRYGRSSSQLKRKLQSIHPELREMTQSSAAQTMPEKTYDIIGLPKINIQTEGEKRALIKNKSCITRERNKKIALNEELERQKSMLN